MQIKLLIIIYQIIIGFDNNIKKCLYCKKKRVINNINKSPRNKSIILNENRINFNNMLIGQMSTKNTNRLSKI